jgi:hypothetical protein
MKALTRLLSTCNEVTDFDVVVVLKVDDCFDQLAQCFPKSASSSGPRISIQINILFFAEH